MSGPISNYAIRMARLSKRIFGEVVRPTDPASMKVVKLLSEQPLAKRKEVYDWYPPHNIYSGLMWRLRSYGLYSIEAGKIKEKGLFCCGPIPEGILPPEAFLKVQEVHNKVQLAFEKAALGQP